MLRGLLRGFDERLEELAFTWKSLAAEQPRSKDTQFELNGVWKQHGAIRRSRREVEESAGPTWP